MSIDGEPRRVDLQQRIDELSHTVEELQRELGELREIAAAQETGSRRHLLKLIGGAAAAGVLAGTAGERSPAAATDNTALNAGNVNFATQITRLTNGTGANSGPGTSLSTEATMFWVDNRTSPQANGNGVRGDGKGVNGAGVWGNSDFGGTGVFGNGGVGVSGAGAIGLKATGTVAAAMFVGTNPFEPRFRSDAHSRGEIDIDANGNLWMCIAAGSPGTWRKLAGPQTAGAFHATLPARVYDSRFAAGPITSGENQVIPVADGHNTTTGVLNAPNVVPVGATAIAGNLTITATARQGFLTVAPGFLGGITASTINWRGDGLDIANGFIVQLDSNRQVRVFAGGGGRTDFIIDVSGFWM